MTICLPWRPANSLNQLKAQANSMAPNRNKASDGTIGDAAHQTEACSSQHNSCCVIVNGIWIIRALDLTHDPAGGFDSYAVAEQLRLSRDPRIRYIISNRRITGPNYGWVWHDYTGSDPHTNHMHVSVWDDQARFDDTSRAWQITASAVAPTSGDEVSVFYMVPNGKGGGDVYNENGVHILSSEFPAALAQRVPLMTVASLARMKELTTPSVTATATVDAATLKQAVVDAINAANADPSTDVNLTAGSIASVADAVVAHLGQKLGTVGA